MLNFVLHFLLSQAPLVWIVACLVAGLAGFFFARKFMIQNWLSLAVAAAVVLVSLIVMHDTRRISDLTTELATQTQQTQELSGSITEYTGKVEQLAKDQKQIRKDIATARKGLDAATLVKESTDDPVKASTDTTDRWNHLNSMFDEATGGEPVAASSASSSSADPNQTGPVEDR